MTRSVPVKGYVKQDGVAVTARSKRVDSDGPSRNAQRVDDLGYGLNQIADGERFREIAGQRVPLVGHERKPGSESISFAGMDLRGEDFSEVDLRGVDFTGANLAGARFGGARLKDVVLTDANIRGADFSGAIVGAISTSPMDFEGAVLNASRIYFSNKMPKVKVLNLPSDMSGVSLSWADLSGQDLREIDTKGTASFHDVDFRGSDLRGAHLPGVIFTDSDFTDADLSGVQAQRSSWSGCKASDVKFTDADLTSAGIEECNFDRCDFSGARFAIGSAFCSDFRGANFVGADFSSGPSFTSCDLREANLSNVDLGKTSFAGASEHPGAYRDFDGDIPGSDLTGVTWTGAKTSKMIILATETHVMPSEEDDGEEVEQEFTAVAVFNMYSLERAVAEMGLTNEQFEFLVLSGVVEVRDRASHQVVKSGFDSEKHYVPDWAIQNRPVVR